MVQHKRMSEEKDHCYGVAIVGAGFGGLGMAIWLKRQLNHQDIVIFERDSDAGGTWWANTYPGAASDYPIHGYSFSTDLKPDWNKTHGSQAEIQEYIFGLMKKYDLRRRCVFNTAVELAEWVPGDDVWRVTTRHVKTGEKTSVTAKILISAVGLLAEPHNISIPGSETFKGASFHSARWDHSVDLSGKRVALIGNGCSAAQIAPTLANDPSIHITNFCRTRMWYVEGSHQPYSDRAKWVFSHFPLVMRLYRWWIQLRYDLNFIAFRERNFGTNKSLEKTLIKYIKDKTPAEYHDQLIPDYPPGCRRLIYDNGFLFALSKPNLELNWDGIESLTSDGIITKKGEHVPADVIVFATGFVPDKFTLDVRGRDGEPIAEYYRRSGGPIGYLGSTAPNFPNFITLIGPNTATGHYSVLYAHEVQFNYAIQLIGPILSSSLSSFEVTPKATDKFNAWIDRRLATSVWTHCVSWYRTGHKGRIFTNWPGPMMLFWWMARSPRWADYTTKGPQKTRWVMERRLWSSATYLLTGLIAALAIQNLRA